MAETREAANQPDVEFTRPSELGLAVNGAAVGGPVEASSPASCGAAVEALTVHFPDAFPSQIALAVFATFAARVSETRAATLALGNADAAGDPHALAFFEFRLTAENTFADALEAVSRSGFGSDSGPVAAASVSTGSVPPLVVRMETGSASELSSGLELRFAADGSITLISRGGLDASSFALFVERLTALATGLAAEPRKALVHQPIMSADERKTVVETWNATDRYYGYDGGLVAMMERAAAATPDHPALIFKDETLSFAEFNARVNRLARLLRDKGVGPDRFVALFMDRSLEMVVGLWATIKAGGAYVPLNTEDPSGRLTEIIEDSTPVAVLTQPHLLEKIETDVAEVIVLPEGGDAATELEAGNLGIEIGPHDLAYMIYTSGSTGKPKGVIIEHEAIHNRVVWMHEEYGLEPQDRVLQKTPYTFDVSVWEFLWPFAVGSTLVVAIPDGHRSIRYLKREIRQSGVTHLHFVPSMLRLFLLAPPLDELQIKQLFCSGEALGFDLVQAFYEKASDSVEVHNLYGPTEAAVDVSYFACPRKSSDHSIPIGKPVTNTGLYVLDEYDQPVPIGVPGELHIGGVQLARGYWNRDDLTKERFIPCPVEDAPHRRLYRTGDLAYFRQDGEIIYLGRNDFQVKISGVRIELGEIEAAIRSADGVRDVVVVAEENEGQKSLVAYVVAEVAGDAAAAAIKTAVSEKCPPFYVPQDVRFLAEMPLTVSGKINRKLLKDQPRL